MQDAGYVLAHGLITLSVRTEAGEEILPAALYNEATGEEALRLAGPRARRVARWDQQGWTLYWDLLAQLVKSLPTGGASQAGSRPVLAALPPRPEGAELPAGLGTAYHIPPTIALRAAGELSQGVALYLGAFAWELAAFGPAAMDDPTVLTPGLEPLYRRIITETFCRERRPLLPVQVPALLCTGDYTLEVEKLLEPLWGLLPPFFEPFPSNPPPCPASLEEGGDLVSGISSSPPPLEGGGRGGDLPLSGWAVGQILFGGEDAVVVAQVAEALRARGYEVSVADPLVGLERLLRAVGGIA